MRNIVLGLVAMATLFAFSGEALAGGGAKKNATIKVTNNTAFIAAVILDNTNPPTEEAAFVKAGGKLIQPGKSYSFKVTAGAHNVVAQLIDSEDGSEVGTPTLVNRTVGKGKTLSLSVTGTATAAISP